MRRTFPIGHGLHSQTERPAAARSSSALEFEYGISAESVAPIIEAYRKEGFGFADYPGASGYGISLTSPEWIRRVAAEIGLGEVYFRARGWDDHQDVYGFTVQNLRTTR